MFGYREVTDRGKISWMWVGKNLAQAGKLKKITIKFERNLLRLEIVVKCVKMIFSEEFSKNIHKWISNMCFYFLFWKS